MGRKDFKLVEGVAVSSILLDTHNARIRAGADQNDCMSRILRKESQLLVLAESIVKDGLTTMPILASPTSGKKWIVKDGNRRITALKILNDPDICPEKHLVEKFRAIRAKNPSNVPSHVDLLVSSNESAVVAEVLSRHSGALEGAGR